MRVGRYRREGWEERVWHTAAKKNKDAEGEGYS